MTKKPVLYSSAISANGRKVLALCDYLNLQIDSQEINVYQGAGQEQRYKSINALGKIPSLVDGDFILHESNAILHYLAKVYGQQRLLFKEPQLEAQMLRWLFWEAAHWQPAISNVIGLIVGHQLVPQLIPAPTSAPNWQDEEFIKHLTLLESHLQNQLYLIANQLSIADFSIAGMVTYFHFANFPFASYPNFSAWYQRINALPAWQATAVKPWTVNQ